ncbi:alpha/beta fold hydrolase [Polluticaenibacter yanchengensis]|uniref:Alpha/beta hydrolase n=1 Tax=Polluticaenibacter yanchengensis TaxID=3014562 RepID=A0ABT4UND5_9BACT|nr:alpha/beta hydrolase [Chitinophagaceae bacterium LY-5]
MEQFVIYKDTTISYKTYGAGKPVMLIHGFSEKSFVWEQLITELKDNYLVIVPDMPGYNKDCKVGEQDIFVAGSIHEVAKAMIAVIRSSGLNDVTVLGHSMGGYIALEMLYINAGLIKGLGLLHSTANVDNEEKKEARLKTIDFLERNESRTFIKSTIANLFGSEINKKAPGIVNEFYEAVGYINENILVANINAMLNRRMQFETIEKSGVPILFIIGEEDKAIPVADVFTQTTLGVKSFVYLLQKCGHMGMIENPGQFNKAVKEYLKYFD